MDDEVVEQFSFMDDTRIVATLGTKNGAICGPVLRYRLPSDGSIEIIDSDGLVMYRWAEVLVSTDLLSVVCDGRSKKYRITRAPEKERYLP